METYQSQESGNEKFIEKNGSAFKKENPTRYSDEELKEFKEIILFKLKDTYNAYNQLVQILSLKGDHGTDDTAHTFKLSEDAADVFSKEEAALMATRQQKYIEHLENALIRIENKTYGICRLTGKLIAKERLRSVPHTTLSIDAKK
ncbi:MAG: TraR/DksA family transcriptional regulator [Bacteroidia bacterium]